MPMPTGEIGDAPLEEFIDPQSAIASILNQMQGAATRSRGIPYDPFNPMEHQGPGLETMQNANRPMPTNARPDPQDVIRMLLEERRTAGGPLDLTPLYR